MKYPNKSLKNKEKETYIKFIGIDCNEEETHDLSFNKNMNDSPGSGPVVGFGDGYNTNSIN